VEPEPIPELPVIALDFDRPGVPIVPEPAQPIEALELPVPPEPFGFDIPAWETLDKPAATGGYPAQPEYEWNEITSAGAPGLPPLELEPLPFPTGEPAPDPTEVSADLASTLSDIDFQLDYGSPEEAKIEIDCALQIYPRHPELLRRLDQAESSLQRLGKHPGPEVPSETDFEHSFFDLSDVVGDALLESGEGDEMHDATNVVEKIQSVDELFNAFREGVEQQVKGDDYETHYNLGIAYKEMLLLEPAMEEFKKAMRDPERTLECCSMLSICEQAANNLDGAVAWLHQGIEAPGFPPEDSMGLHYDLGVLLLEQGRRDEALEEFRTVAEQDPEYRDVARMMQ
jgi:tetratricopeptide (TPR) repeat protein